jgi:hypothetical protein
LEDEGSCDEIIEDEDDEELDDDESVRFLTAVSFLVAITFVGVGVGVASVSVSISPSSSSSSSMFLDFLVAGVVVVVDVSFGSLASVEEFFCDCDDDEASDCE